MPPHESGARTALTGLAFLSVGEASAAGLFQRALEQNAPAGPTAFLLGAARAAQARDADAVVAWQAALQAGAAPAVTRRLLAEALLRRNDPRLAADALTAAAGAPPTGASVRVIAATHLANRREADAIAILESRLDDAGGDQEARWLLLHAMYSQFVRGGKPLGQSGLQTFTRHAHAYIDANGANAALAAGMARTAIS